MPPFDILSCSWPRPVRESASRWESNPEWDAPRMPQLPVFQDLSIQGQTYWAVDWRQTFSADLRFHSPWRSGEMRGFHVVFQIRIRDSGTLVFWDDDGCVIRRGGQLVHEDRECHALTRHEISVRAGDCLEIAHWQYHGDWIWAGRLEPQDNAAATIDIFNGYLPRVQEALREPNGPPLKMFFGGSAPARSILCLYSTILRGYRPSSIHIFGEYQWDGERRGLFEQLLPFATIAPTAAVLERIASVRRGLEELALAHWQVMKLCIGLLCDPCEYGFQDDDIFILDSVTDALQAFERCDLVYAPDADNSIGYRGIWGGKDQPLPTGNINTGLYWLRNKHEPAALAERILAVPPHRHFLWEQGFMAVEYANDAVQSLSTQRYFYPYFDGLPGGIVGYDYGTNPSGFASVHFGGLAEKPSDSTARMLAGQVLPAPPKRQAR